MSSSDLWYVHYTVVIPDPRARPPSQADALKALLEGKPVASLSPRTQELVAGPYEGFEAVLERRKLLKTDSVVDAFLDRASVAKSVVVTRTAYRGTGS
jgi:hypothetical protein